MRLKKDGKSTGKEGILKKKKKNNIKAAARMRFLGFVDMIRTKGQAICASLMKNSEMRG